VNLKERSYTLSPTFEAYTQAVASLEAAARSINVAARELYSADPISKEIERMSKLSDLVRKEEVQIMDLCVNWSKCQEITDQIEAKMKKGEKKCTTRKDHLKTATQG
jgi:DNA repair ATPase RecN